MVDEDFFWGGGRRLRGRRIVMVKGMWGGM